MLWVLVFIIVSNINKPPDALYQMQVGPFTNGLACEDARASLKTHFLADVDGTRVVWAKCYKVAKESEI